MPCAPMMPVATRGSVHDIINAVSAAALMSAARSGCMQVMMVRTIAPAPDGPLGNCFPTLF